MRTTKTRNQFYLPDGLSSKLDASKTAILSDALTAWIERGAVQEIDDRFGPRLDRMSRNIERIERTVDQLSEMVGIFVQHQLTLTAHQPAFGGETARLGRERYQPVVEMVGRRIAERRSIAAPKPRGDG